VPRCILLLLTAVKEEQPEMPSGKEHNALQLCSSSRCSCMREPMPSGSICRPRSGSGSQSLLLLLSLAWSLAVVLSLRCQAALTVLSCSACSHYAPAIAATAFAEPDPLLSALVEARAAAGLASACKRGHSLAGHDWSAARPARHERYPRSHAMQGSSSHYTYRRRAMARRNSEPVSKWHTWMALDCRRC
jgi:hypothetical protein